MSAGMPGMALQNPNQSPEQTGKGTSIPNRLDGVLAACRRKTTARWKKRTDPGLVDPNQSDQKF
jgi:hypothetical protein